MAAGRPIAGGRSRASRLTTARSSAAAFQQGGVRRQVRAARVSPEYQPSARRSVQRSIASRSADLPGPERHARGAAASTPAPCRTSTVTGAGGQPHLAGAVDVGEALVPERARCRRRPRRRPVANSREPAERRRSASPSASRKRTRTGVGLPVAASLTRTWTVSMAVARAGHLVLRPGAVEDGLERRDRLREQFRPGDAAGRAAAEQVRLQRGEAVVAARHGVGDHLGDAALPLAGQAAVLLAGDPVLDVEVGRHVLRLLPALPRVVAAEDVVGRVVDRPEGVGCRTAANRSTHAVRRVAVDAVLVLVQQADAGLLGQPRLLCHAVEHLAAPLSPTPFQSPLAGRVVAEDADVRRVEDLAQLDGPLEALQVRLERLVDLDLADGRADGAEAEAVPVEQRLELAAPAGRSGRGRWSCGCERSSMCRTPQRSSTSICSCGSGEISSAKALRVNMSRSPSPCVQAIGRMRATDCLRLARLPEDVVPAVIVVDAGQHEEEVGQAIEVDDDLRVDRLAVRPASPRRARPGGRRCGPGGTSGRGGCRRAGRSWSAATGRR